MKNNVFGFSIFNSTFGLIETNSVAFVTKLKNTQQIVLQPSTQWTLSIKLMGSLNVNDITLTIVWKGYLTKFSFWDFSKDFEASPIIHLEHPLCKYQGPLSTIRHTCKSKINIPAAFGKKVRTKVPIDHVWWYCTFRHRNLCDLWMGKTPKI